MRRLALPSAVVRSSKLGCTCDPGAMPSTSIVTIPVPASATARLAPTMPPPMMATSTLVAGTGLMGIGRSAPRHHGFDGVRILGCMRRQHLDTCSRNDDVVLDANTDVVHPLGHTPCARRNVNARLDRHDHPWLEHTPLVPDLV